MKQMPLAHVQKEIDGIEMGVLDDGTPFLSMRALSKLCGVANSSLSETIAAWSSGARASNRLAAWLESNGVERDQLFIDTQIQGVAGNVVKAVPEDVSSLVLEYYAFERETEQAKRAYRITSRAGLRTFIYNAVGYDPGNRVPIEWRQFHDRMLLVSSPVGYFSVFKESAEFVITAIRGGLPCNETSVPDVSIGKTWSKHWEDNGLAAKYGERTKHDHNYPDYFPQAASNPQPIHVYPVDALGEFRRWLHTTYVPEKFPSYLERKVRTGVMTASTAQILVLSATPPPPAVLPKASG